MLFGLDALDGRVRLRGLCQVSIDRDEGRGMAAHSMPRSARVFMRIRGFRSLHALGRMPAHVRLRLSGTLPPLSASLVMTCSCSQTFMSAEPSSLPL